MAHYDGSIVGTCMNCGMALREYSKHVEVRFSDGAAPASAYYCEDCAPFVQSNGKAKEETKMGRPPGGFIVGHCLACGAALQEWECAAVRVPGGLAPALVLYCKGGDCAPIAESKAEEARVTLSDIPMMVAQHYAALVPFVDRGLVYDLTRDYHAHLLSIATVGNPPEQPTEGDDDKWISVHDGMPEPKKRVLVWHQGMGSADAGAWWPAEQRVPAAWYDDTGERYSDDKITHWQPLPGKPRGLE